MLSKKRQAGTKDDSDLKFPTSSPVGSAGEYKVFQIHCGTYDFTINFVITKDLVRACKFINFKLELPNMTEVAVNDTDFNCLGKRFYIHGYCPIIWLSEFPKTPEQIGTAIHEIFHTVCDCMRWANVPLTIGSEEAYCHLIKYITKNFFKKMQGVGV